MQMPEDLQTNASLLILEIGNSHISVATCVAESIRTNERFSLGPLDPVMAYADQAWNALPNDRVKSMAAASTVPKVLDDLRERLTTRYQQPVLVVGSELHRPISLAMEAPEKVGMDRVCSAAAAYDVIGRACVIASFGTATTIDCVNEEGAFMGGAILPGLDMQAKALHDGTAALPLVHLEATQAIYGTTTEEAIRTGIIHGAVGAMREITERYATSLCAWPQLIVTGGYAKLIAEHCDFVDNVVPDLCIRGIALAYRKHFAAFDDD